MPELWDIWFGICNIHVAAVSSMGWWRQLLYPLVHKAGAAEDFSRGGHDALPLALAALGNDRDIWSIFEVGLRGTFLKIIVGKARQSLSRQPLVALPRNIILSIHVSIGWPDVSTLHSESQSLKPVKGRNTGSRNNGIDYICHEKIFST